MAQRSTVELLPEDVRHALERRLAESGFSNYSELTDWLKSQGYEISRSGRTPVWSKSRASLCVDQGQH